MDVVVRRFKLQRMLAAEILKRHVVRRPLNVLVVANQLIPVVQKSTFHEACLATVVISANAPPNNPANRCQLFLSMNHKAISLSP